MNKKKWTCGCATTTDIVSHHCGKGWRRDLTEQGVAIEKWLERNAGKCGIDYKRMHGGYGTYQ